MARVAVIGAGISGLVTAYSLQSRGHQVVVLERSGAVGGRMQTRSEGGFTWDAGAQFMLPLYTHMKRLMAELGIFMSPTKIDSMTGILLPTGRLFYTRPASFTGTLAHPALSARSKWRLGKVLLAALQHRRRLDFHFPELAAPIDKESLRTWGDREIGADAVDHLLSVPASTLFFWRPEETPWWMPVALAAAGSAWRVQTPRGGMGSVPEALARRLDVWLQTAVRRVETLPDGTASVRTDGPGGRADLTADRVVIAAPAPIALSLLPDPDAALGRVRAGFLKTARYVSNVTVAAAYRKAPETRAYGIGVPTAFNHKLAAIGWDHLKGPERAPAGAGLGVLMPTDRYSRQVWSRSDDEVAQTLVQSVEEIYPGSRSHLIFQRAQRWEHAMPVQAPGRAAAVAEALAAGPVPGSPVFACGDYWGGPTTEHALASGLRTAQEVLQSLNEQGG